jgi:hypothetical protein
MGGVGCSIQLCAYEAPVHICGWERERGVVGGRVPKWQYHKS